MFGNKLRQLRENQELSQLQLSKILNISQQTLSKWENNISEPDILSLKAIATHFNISLDFLLDHKYNEKENKKAIKRENIRSTLVEYHILKEDDTLTDNMIDIIFTFVEHNKDYIIKVSV